MFVEVRQMEKTGYYSVENSIRRIPEVRCDGMTITGYQQAINIID